MNNHTQNRYSNNINRNSSKDQQRIMINNSNSNIQIIVRLKIQRVCSTIRKAIRIGIFRMMITSITITTRRTTNCSQKRQKIENIKKLKLFCNRIGIIWIKAIMTSSRRREMKMVMLIETRITTTIKLLWMLRMI